MFLSNHAAPFITFIKFSLCISEASIAAPVCPELPSATSLYPPTPSPLVQLTPGGFSPLTAALPACHTQLHLFFLGPTQEGPDSTSLAGVFAAGLRVPRAVQSSSLSAPQRLLERLFLKLPKIQICCFPFAVWTILNCYQRGYKYCQTD